MALSVSRLVRVTVNLGAVPAAGRTFNSLLILGDSDVISGAERIREYRNIEDVAADFGLAAPEYEAAALYFGQSPQPEILFIGRWLEDDTSGFNLGGILSSAEQELSLWTDISSGGFKISIDGAADSSLTALDFSAVTNLNGVASIITGALTGAVCTWDGQEFQIESASTGPGEKAVGSIELTGNPASGDTLTVNSTEIEFVPSSPIGDQVVIGGSASDTFDNLLAFLQSSLDSDISDANYASSSALLIDVEYKIAGTAGNAFTLTKVSSAISLSGVALSGGTQPSSIGYAIAPASGTDISGMLKLTSATSQGLVEGYDQESPVEAVAALTEASSVWYGVMFASEATVSDAESLEISDFVEALEVTRMYGVTTQNTGTLSAMVTNDLASLMKLSAYDQSFCSYSSDTPYAVASMFGRMFSVDFDAQNSTITLMYKQMPGVAAEVLTNAQANALQDKNCNVYVGYDNDTSILQYGALSSGRFIDEVWGLDWYQNAVQTAVYNVMFTAPTKIPQTDSGLNQLVNSCNKVSGDQPGGAVYNGLAAPGVWNSTTVFGSLTTGQYLPLGYYTFASPIGSQSQADRAARKAPPIQIALKLAGAFQEADILVTVNQ